MTAPEKPRVVLDCMVYLQAIASETGTAAAILRLWEQGALVVFISREVLEEIRDVLARPRIRRKNPQITDERVHRFLERLLRDAEQLTNVPRAWEHPRDPKDEKYLNLAIASGAHALVSWDNDLLDLMRMETPEAGDFRRRFPPCVSWTRLHSSTRCHAPTPDGRTPAARTR